MERAFGKWSTTHGRKLGREEVVKKVERTGAVVSL